MGQTPLRSSSPRLHSHPLLATVLTSVFPLAIAVTSHYHVNGQYRGYHGEITVDPSNGQFVGWFLEQILSRTFRS